MFSPLYPEPPAHVQLGPMIGAGWAYVYMLAALCWSMPMPLARLHACNSPVPCMQARTCRKWVVACLLWHRKSAGYDRASNLDLGGECMRHVVT